METQIDPKDLDKWIAGLEDCKQLEESQVKVLCEKVRNRLNMERERERERGERERERERMSERIVLLNIKMIYN